MYPRVWLVLAAGVSAILTAGCGSVVHSKEEDSPPAGGTEMQGLAYWLPKGAIVIEGKWDKDSSDWAITVTPYIDADTSPPHWRLTRKVNHLFEDNVTLEVDATTGLLQTVTATSEDKSAAIAAAGLAIAAKAMTFGAAGAIPGPSSLRRAERAVPLCSNQSSSVEFVGSFRYMINSSDLPKDETSSTCRTLVVWSAPTPAPSSTNGVGPTPTATPAPPPTATPSPTPVKKTYNIIVYREDKHGPRETQNPVRIRGQSDGIVVRAPAPYHVAITVNDKPNLMAEQLLFLPDTQRDYYLPLDRSPFIKNDTQIALVKGVVQKVTVVRPSIILGIVGVPKTILEALVPLSSH